MGFDEPNADDQIPAKPQVNPFEAFLGYIPAFSSLEENNAWVRVLRDDNPGGAENP